MAVRRMTPLGQRLIAAGAQPERAQQFVDRAQFDKGPQLTTFKGAGMPKKLGDPFDDQSRAASETRPEFSMVFRPVTDTTAPTFKQYVDVVLGKGAYDSLTTKYTKGLAPTFDKALTAPVGSYEYVIANGIKDGLSPEVVYQSALDLGITGTRTDSAVNSYVYKLYDEYTKKQNFDVTEEVLKLLNKNKYYQYGLPDPKLQYGIVTDLSKGTVGILTNPAVAKEYKKFVAGLSGDPQAERKIDRWVATVLAQANRERRTPYLDEVKRRERFRGKQVGG